MANEDKLERLLDQTVLVDPQNPLPLYAQLTRGLLQLIHAHFEDGERFFGEEMLSRRLGISVSTTRRALCDLAAEGLLERHVPKGTFVRKKVIAAQDDFSVGVFVSSFDSRFNMVLLDNIAWQCKERGYRLELFHTYFGEKLVEEFSTIKKPPDQQGFIFLTTFEASTWNLYQALAERGYRTVVIDRRIEGYPGIYVGVDNTAAIRLGMDHLTALGHRRITLLVCEYEFHPNIQERIRAFQASARNHSLRETHIVSCDQNPSYPAGSRIEERYEMNVSDASVDEILSADPPPTAVFAVSDAGARVLLRRLAERGVRVPQDLSVMGLGDEGYANLTFPPLTTVAQPFEEIVRRAIGLIETPGHVTETHLLSPSLVIRSSTGPAPPLP